MSKLPNVDFDSALSSTVCDLEDLYNEAQTNDNKNGFLEVIAGCLVWLVNAKLLEMEKR